jgi:hypothetical protein
MVERREHSIKRIREMLNEKFDTQDIVKGRMECHYNKNPTTGNTTYNFNYEICGVKYKSSFSDHGFNVIPIREGLSLLESQLDGEQWVESFKPIYTEEKHTEIRELKIHKNPPRYIRIQKAMKFAKSNKS